MACITGRAWLSDDIVGSTLVAHSLRGGCSLQESIASRISLEYSIGGTAEVGVMLRGRCGIMCGIGESGYLIVEPNDVVWLTPDNDFAQELAVYSNVNWTVE